MASKIVKLIESKNGMVVVRSWGEEKMGSYQSTVIKFQPSKMNKL